MLRLRLRRQGRKSHLCTFWNRMPCGGSPPRCGPGRGCRPTLGNVAEPAESRKSLPAALKAPVRALDVR
jgi:hypothetical protein